MKSKFLIACCASVLSACASAEPTPTSALRPTASRGAISATLAPSANTPTPNASTGTLSPYVLYDDKSAPFTLQYPRGWNVREEPEAIFFIAPDATANLHIILYEYPEAAPRNIAAKDVLANFAPSFAQGNLRLTQSVTNPDGSISSSVEYTDASTRQAQQGQIRVLISKNRRYHFIALFAAARDQFTRYRATSTAVLDSFRER